MSLILKMFVDSDLEILKYIKQFLVFLLSLS